MRLTDYWMARLMLCSYVLVSVIVTWFDSGNTTNHILNLSFDVVWWVIPSVALLTFIGLFDLLVNDFLPRKVNLFFLHDRRHLLYIAIGFGSMGIAAVVASTDGWSTILLKYWLDACFAAMLAFLEMFPRLRNKRTCP